MEKTANIIVSNTLLNSFVNVLNKLKISIENPNENNVIIVPDRFSLFAEKLFFETLKLDSTFNVEIMTLSRFVNKNLKCNNLNVLNRQSAIMQIEKILLLNSNQFTTFGKLTKNENFAEILYDTITQLKSSGITSSDITSNKYNNYFGEKLNDIAFVFSKYDEMLGNEIFDATSKLSLFNSQIKNINEIKNLNLYVAMFDSFTFQQVETLKELAKYCKKLVIGFCFNNDQDNKGIYLNETLQKILSKFNEEKILYNIENFKAEVNNTFSHLLNNLFSYKSSNKIESNGILIYENKDEIAELKNVASQIKMLVCKDGYSFNDISVAVNNLQSYKFNLKNIFNDYSIPFFLDSHKPLMESIYAKFLMQICDVVLNNFEMHFVLNLIKNDLINFSSEQKNIFENYCLKYGINYNEFLKPFTFEKEPNFIDAELVRKKMFSSLKILKEKILSGKTPTDYLNAISNYLLNENIQVNFNSLTEKVEDVVEKKLSQQVSSKIEKLFSNVVEGLGNVEMPFEYFVQILNSGLSAEKISTVPLKVNSVYVGDSSESMFSNCKILLVLNCKEGAFPIYKLDCGLITDEEIENFKSKNIISPSIKFINKREKFKLLQLLSLPDDKLILSYANSVGGEKCTPSEVVLQVKNMFLKNNCEMQVVKTDNILNNIALITDEKEKVTSLAYCLGNVKNSLLHYLTHLNEEYFFKDILSKKFSKQLIVEKNNKNIGNSKELFFNNNSTKISQIEDYFACPFKHFVEYGLKLKQQELFEITPLDIGNLIHKIAEEFVNELIKLDFVAESLVENLAQSCFNKVILNQQIDKFNLKVFQLNSLKLEAVRLCKAIFYQIVNSDFKPTKTEFSFNSFVLENGYKLNGKIDRVDEFSNYIKLIDYKTGNTQFEYKNVFYGKKLQLPIYAYVLKKLTGKNVAGFFYFPSRNSYNLSKESEFSSYKLSGVFLNNETIIKALDKNLNNKSSSDIIKADYIKSGDLSKISKNVALTNEEMSGLMNYANCLLIKAIQEIENGNINASPTREVCEYCPHKSVCKYSVHKSGYRKCSANITKEYFSKKEQAKWVLCWQLNKKWQQKN